MTTDDINEKRRVYNLSRRRVLGGLGAVGLASAGAGLGTTALFSDTESFDGNVLAAGALDLVVDWEEHYYWDQDEVQALDIQYSEPSDVENYVGFPHPTDPLVWVHMDDVDAFMDATSLEAYPDTDNDGTQDDLFVDDESVFDECADFAQLDANLNPDMGRGAGKRSANPDTILNYSAYQEGAAPDIAPLVNLQDVKPGDFGELTLSFHLCDNPGYTWLQGDLVEARENGHTEPEAADVDEVGGPNTVNATGTDVELLDEIQTMLWYDEDGDNIYEPGGASGDVDVVLVIDDSGSMGSGPGSKLENAKNGAKLFVDAVGASTQIGVVSFDDAANVDLPLTMVSGNEATIKSAIDGISGGGTTDIEDGILTGDSVLKGTGSRAGASQVMVLLSDGEPVGTGASPDTNNSPVEEAAAIKPQVEIFTIGYGISGTSTFAATLREVASDPDSSHAYLDVNVDEPTEISNVFGQIGQVIAGEELFFTGSLRELLTATSTDVGIPLDGNRGTEYAEVDASNLPTAGDDPAREEFVNSTNNFVGLAWWLPVDHANEIQTDSVSFDLGFYTEQSRHNDGAGISSTTTTTTSV
ncbi:MAG: VWA domain-containing protein [Halobacteriaceae archaeon]